MPGRVIVWLSIFVVLDVHAAQWQTASPDGTGCWNGAPWKLWYREADPEKLVVWFQGGGGCWRDAICDVTGDPSFDGSVGEDDDPANSGGLFDFARNDNPIRDWSVLFVPYCTGDVHIGNRTVEYTRADGTRFSFAHQGARNVRAALDWLRERSVSPRRLLVSGESAGAIAAAFWTLEIGDRFPQAALVTIGDAAGGYRARAVNGVLRQWGVLDQLPELAAYRDPEAVYFESFYLAAAERHPRARLTQVNFADDAVQRQFLDLLGAPVAELTKPLTCNMNEIRLDAPGFKSYIYPGTEHVMLRTPAVYTTRCAGQSLIAWIDDVLAGRTVENRWCEGVGDELLSRPAPRL